MESTRPKIILPVLSLEPRYAFDEENTLFTGGGNGPYYMVRAREDADISTLYLLALLNHPLSEAIVRTNTSTFRGGYYSHGKQFIENLPVPVPEEAQQNAIEAKAAELIAAIDDLGVARMPRARTHKEREVNELRSELNRMVSAIFGLSAPDMATISAVPIPS